MIHYKSLLTKSLPKSILAAGVSLALASSAQAAEPATVWTLDSCISYAVSHNLNVRGRQYEQLNGEVAVDAAKDRFLPRANAYASQSFAFGRGLNAENTYSDRNTSTFSWGAQAELPLFQGLSAVRGLEQAKVSLRKMVYEVEAAKEDIALNVISQYLQTLYAEEMINVARLQLNMSRVELERRVNMLDAGKIAELDVLQSQSQVAQDELTLVNARNDHSLALLDLAQLLQLPDTVGFRIATLADSPIPIIDPEEVYENALRTNSSILAARTGIELADKSISLARTGYIPTLSFNAGIGSSYYHLSGIDNSGFGSQMRNNLSKTLGFSLSVPIFDAFSTRRNISRAKVQRLTAELQLESTTTALYKAIQQAYFQAVGAERKRVASEVATNTSRAALDAMTVKYDCGRANATEYEQARLQYITNLSQSLQARYEALLRTRILQFYSRPTY